MACSVYGAQFLLEALYKAGEADYALDLMRATEGDRNWWNMIRSGSTITLEAWDKKYKPNLDWNHAWGTAPANIITRYLWGITPGSPGFGSVKIMPQLSQLTYSRIKVPTLKGPIYAEFKKINNNSKSFTINLPAGTEGEFILIDTECSKILLNNKAIKTESGLIPLKEGRNQIEIRNQKEP